MFTQFFRFTLLATVAIACIGSSVIGSTFPQKSYPQNKSVQTLTFGVKEPLVVTPIFNRSADWLKDFTLEVKNISGRPIYFVEYALVLPPFHRKDTPIAFRLVYGRNDLVNVDHFAEQYDAPIQPGETISLKLPEGTYASFLWHMQRQNAIMPAVTDAKLVIQSINFGDGTGWQGGKLRSQEIDRLIETEEKEAAAEIVTSFPTLECNTYRRIPTGDPNCDACDVTNSARIGAGNERVLLLTVFCLDPNGVPVSCRGFVIFPCSF